LALCACIVSSRPVGPRGAGESPEGQRAQRPVELEFKSAKIDIGEAFVGESTPFEFEFTNVSERAVTIASIQPRCNCISMETESVTVGPGESGVLRGSREHRLQDAPEIELRIKTDAHGPGDELINVYVLARTKPRYAADPPVMDLGNIYFGQSAKAEFIVRALDPAAPDATGWRLEDRGSGIRAAWTLADGDDPRSKRLLLEFFPIHGKTSASGLRSFQTAAFAHPLIFTGDPVQPVVEVQVLGRVLGPIAIVEPQRYLYYGVLPPDRLVMTERIKFHRQPGSDARISQIGADPIKLTITKSPIFESDEAEMELQLDFSGLKGLVKSILVIRSINPDYTTFIEIIAYVD
jgi:hypothetical protein